MKADLRGQYERASEWTASTVAGASDKLDARTPCDDWDVATLLNHMLDTQRYFAGAARGEDPSLPSPQPPDLLSDDPVEDFRAVQAEVMRAYGEPGVIEKTGPALGIAFTDPLVH